MKVTGRRRLLSAMMSVLIIIYILLGTYYPYVSAEDINSNLGTHRKAMRINMENEGTVYLENGDWINGPFGYRTSHFSVTLNQTITDAYCVDPSANTPPSGNYRYYIQENGEAGTSTYAAASILYQYEYNNNQFKSMWEASMDEAGVPDADRSRFDLNNTNSTYFMLHSLVANCWHAGAVWDSGEDSGAYEIAGHQEFKHAFAIFYTRLLLADHPDGYQVYFVNSGSGYQNIIFSNYEPYGKIVVNKQSQYITIQNENPELYSLEGAEYGIYASYDNAEQDQGRMETLVISNGSAVSHELKVGTYYVREIKASMGYRLNPDIIEVTVNSGTETPVTSIETILYDTVSLRKVSSNPEYTDGNPAYSLAGAQYQIYKDSSCTIKAMGLIVNSANEIIGDCDAILITDEDGNTNTLNLARGTYYVKETVASPGYLLNPEIIQVNLRNVDQSEPYIIDTVETPVMASAKITIQKRDSENISMLHVNEAGNLQPGLGGATLEGAVFQVKYYGSYYQTSALLPDHADAVWYINTLYNSTSKTYEALLDQEHLAEGYVSSPFYYNSENQISLPLGTISVTELQAPVGYQSIADTGYIQDQGGIVENNVVMIQVIGKDDDNDGHTDHAHIYVRDNHSNDTLYSPYVVIQEQSPIICNEVIRRGDIRFSKTELKSGREMDHVFFRITASWGESHIVCTDSRGYYSSTDVSHTHNTNALDQYYDTDGHYLGPDDPEELLRQLNSIGNCGLWFYGTSDTEKWDTQCINNQRGALRYDADGYLIEELPGPFNQGKQLVSKLFCMLENNSIIWLGNIANVDIPELHTLEWDYYSRSHSSAGAGNFESRIMDTVTYTNLPENTVYTVKGILMELGEDGSVVGPLQTEDGEDIQAYTVFQTPKSVYSTVPYVNGSVDVEYNFFSSFFAGKKFVIYEYLFGGEDTMPLQLENGDVITDGVYRVRDTLIMHTDAEDQNQIGTFLSIHTYAMEYESGQDSCVISDAMRIADVVKYENLIPEYEYKLYGELMYRNERTGSIKPVLDNKGVPVTAEIHFVPEAAHGDITLDFPEFHGGQLMDNDGICVCSGIVVYETLLWNNQIMAVHKDINDQDQTVRLLKQGRIQVKKTADQVVSENQEMAELPNGEQIMVHKLQRDAEPYAGVTFGIFDAATDELVGSFRTDEEGVGTSEILIYGDDREYYIMETDVDSAYIQDNQRYPIRFLNYIPDELCSYTDIIDVHNQARLMKLILHKQEEVLSTDEGNGFLFQRKDAGNVYYGIYNRSEISTVDPANTISSDTLIGIMQTGEDGFAYMEESLPEGNYYCKELCPSGEEYITDDTEYEFIVQYPKNEESEYIIRLNNNQPILNRYKCQQVNLHKVDDSNIPIEGVEFALYRKCGEEYQWIRDYTTDSNGLIHLERVPYGEYYFIETKGVDGYEFDGERRYDFSIVADQLRVTASMLEITQYGQAVDEISNHRDIASVEGSIAIDGIDLIVVNKKIIPPEVRETPTYTRPQEKTNEPAEPIEPSVLDTTDVPSTPVTGDQSPLLLWWVGILGLSTLIGYFLIIRHNRRHHSS